MAMDESTLSLFITSRTCLSCGDTYPATTEYFQKRRARPSGLDTHCKACRSAYLRRQRRAYPEKFSRWRKAAYYRYHEENKARMRAYAASHGEDYRRRYHERRQRISASMTHHDDWDAAAAYVKQRGFCALCGASLHEGHEVDHIIPLAKGGSDGPENIQILCPPCNGSKGAR